MTEPSFETLDVDRTEGIATITIQGVNELNALNQRTTDELSTVTADLSEDDDIRCLVLTGGSNAFGGGADLGHLTGSADDAMAVRWLASTLHDAVVNIHQAEKPIVTAVNGVAAGAGFSLALAGDVVLAIETARFNYAYARVGLTGDGGSTFFLPRLVGLRQAKEILLLDDPIGAEEAVELGIATEAVPVADFEDRVRDVASTLAAGPKFAFGATKRLMTESYARDLPSQLAAETETIVDATRTEDFARGHGAFFENGSAEFIGR